MVFLLFGFCMLRKHWRARKSSNMVEKANLDSEMEKGTYDASDVTEVSFLIIAPEYSKLKMTAGEEVSR